MIWEDVFYEPPVYYIMNFLTSSALNYPIYLIRVGHCLQKKQHNICNQAACAGRLVLPCVRTEIVFSTSSFPLQKKEDSKMPMLFVLSIGSKSNKSF